MLFEELVETRRKERIGKALYLFMLIFAITAIYFAINNNIIFGILFALEVVSGLGYFHIYQYVIPDLDAKNLSEYIKLLKILEDDKSIEVSIMDLLSVTDNYMPDEIIRIFRNELIKYANRNEYGFNTGDAIEIQIVSRISLLITVLIKYPLIKPRTYLYKKTSKYLNKCIMEEILLNFMHKFENYIDVHKIECIDWKWYISISMALPKEKRYQYLFATIVYDILELE